MDAPKKKTLTGNELQLVREREKCPRSIRLPQGLNILGQLPVSTRGDQGQQGVETLGHRGIVFTSDAGTAFTFVVPRFGHEKAAQT